MKDEHNEASTPGASAPLPEGASTPKRVPFQRYIEGTRSGKLNQVEVDPLLFKRRSYLQAPPKSTPPAPVALPVQEPAQSRVASSEAVDAARAEGVPQTGKVPFQKYIKGMKEGLGSIPQPSPTGERYRLGSRVRATFMLGALALVVGGALFLDRYSEQYKSAPPLMSGVLKAPAKGPVPPKGPAVPEKPGPIWLDGYQYLDPAEGRPPEARKDNLAETGDFLTVSARGRQRKWLYFLIMGSNEQFRISRIFPPDVVMQSIPPLKITLRDKVPGQVQVMLVATRDETPQINQWAWDENYKTIRKGDARKQRIDGFLARLKKEIPEEKWAYKLLPSIQYRP